MKICKACKEEVPDDTSGACPKCKAVDGYTVSRTWTFKWNIEDERHEIKRTIDKKFEEYDEFIKQGKNVELYKKLKESLEKQVPDFLEQAEKNALDRIEKNKKTHQISLSMDAIIGTHEQANEYIAKLEEKLDEIEEKNNQLEAQLEAHKLLNQNIDEIFENTKPKSKLRHVGEYLLVFLLGAGASYVGTYFYTLGN